MAESSRCQMATAAAAGSTAAAGQPVAWGTGCMHARPGSR